MSPLPSQELPPLQLAFRCTQLSRLAETGFCQVATFGVKMLNGLCERCDIDHEWVDSFFLTSHAIIFADPASCGAVKGPSAMDFNGILQTFCVAYPRSQGGLCSLPGTNGSLDLDLDLARRLGT